MLEIIALWQLTKRIGQIVENTGRKSGWYKVLTVVLWIVGEFAGAVIGVIVTGVDDSVQCLVYLFALLGAAAGAGIAFLIARNLKPVHETESALRLGMTVPTAVPDATGAEPIPLSREPVITQTEGAPSTRLIVLGVVGLLLGPVLACIFAIYPFATMEANREYGTEQVVVPAQGDLLFEIEPREGRYDYEVLSTQLIDVHYLDEEAIVAYRAGREYTAIERDDDTRWWTGFTQMGGTTDYALLLINHGDSAATVNIGLTFFPLPSFGGAVAACGFGVLIFVGGMIALVAGLRRRSAASASLAGRMTMGQGDSPMESSEEEGGL